MPGVPPPPQVCGGVQSPQSFVPPQPSPMSPHTCWPGGAVGHESGLQAFASPAPHWFGVPPPPHDVPGAQVPHDWVRPPQPFATCPQFAFAGQPVGVQPPTHAPLLQTCPVGQVPQVIEPPQPSGHCPHVWFDGHALSGTHASHVPFTQLAPVGQVPQVMLPVPQPFGYVPHAWPAGQAVSGVHPTHAPLTQLSPVGQLPQSSIPVPHPFGYEPQVTFAGQAVSGLQVGGGRLLPVEGHDDRSKSMNSSARSCGESLPVVHPVGVLPFPPPPP